MNSRRQFWGICALCGRRVTKAAMGRHLTACSPPYDAAAGNPEQILRLRIEDFYTRLYWLDLEMKAKAHLRTLDLFLRDVWLECCQHLSAFTIGGTRYEVAPAPFVASPFSLFADPPTRSMNVPIAKAVSAHGAFHYEYDFGSTTRLRLAVTNERTAAIGRHPIRLLARNEPMRRRCAVCREPATTLCTTCTAALKDILFCTEHARDHAARPHDGGEAMWLPIVNSPRMGVCAYTGPNDDRYEIGDA